jgi:hypothetical protein
MRSNAVIQNAVADDYELILHFLRIANDKNVLGRPTEDYRQAVESGLFYKAEMNRQLIGVAAVFMLSERPPALLEMGSCYIVPELRGFGLQKLLVRARIASVVARVDPDAKILTAISPNNLGSRRSILKAGFEPLTEDARLLIELCAYCTSRPAASSGRECCCDFFYIPRQRQRSEIRALLKPGLVTVSRGSHETMTVATHIDVLKDPHLRAALEAFTIDYESAINTGV